MEDILFWKKWPNGEKSIFLLLIFVLIALFSAYIYFDSQGLHNVLSWDTYVDVENLPISFDQFSRYMLDFNIETENFIVSQYFLPSKYETNSLIGILSFCITAFIASTALTAISMLKEIKWFAGLATIIIAWLTFLHLDTIGLFGLYNKGIVIGIISLFIGLAFYFHAFAEQVSFFIRFLVFTVLTASFLYVVNNYSDVNNSLFFLSSNSYFVTIGAATLFICIVSYDIITAIVYLNAKTRNFNPRSNIINLLGLSSLYLISPVLMFLNKISAVYFEPTYFNVYYLLFISTLISFWAQGKRSVILKGKIPYEPIGSILMVCLAIITFSSISHAHAICNYPLVDYFETLILFSHVAFGVSFLMYVMFNFSPLLIQNIDIRKHLFTPLKDIPYFVVRIMGFGALFSMLFIKNFSVKNDFIAGFYNLKGDVAYYLEDDLMAQYYYDQGDRFASYNFKSNYVLSEMNVERKKFQKAKENIKNALFSAPHPLTYSANQYIHELNNDAFYNMWMLEEGVEKFPNSSHLKNNLAITYTKEAVNKDVCLDLYLDALSTSNNDPLIQSNLLAFCAKNNLVLEADSLQLKFNNKEVDLGLETNKMAIWNHLDKPSTTPDIKNSLKQSDLNNLSSSYLYNATFRQLPCSNELINKTRSLLKNENNDAYLNDLNFLAGIQLFYSGKHDQAKISFDKHLIDCPTSLYPYYSNIFGLMMLQIEADDIANEYFRKSYQSQQFKKVNKSPLYYALSSSSKMKSDSLSTLLEYVSIFDTSYSQYATQLAGNLLLKETDAIITLSDFEKVQLLQLKKGLFNEEMNRAIISSLETNDLKSLSATILMKKSLDQADLNQARNYYAMIPPSITNPFVASKMNIQFLRMLLQSKSYDQIELEAPKLDISEEDQDDFYFVLAKVAIEKRQLDKAEEFIQKLLKESPLDVNGLILEAQYHSVYKKDIQKGYDLLVKATAINPTSIQLTKAYALQCLDMNLETFAESTLNDLSYDLDKKEFADFMMQYQEHKIIAEERFNNW